MPPFVNARTVSCRKCSTILLPGTGQPTPEGLPLSIGDHNKIYMCPSCYKWAAEYVVLYQSARKTRSQLAPHIARIDEGDKLVLIYRQGQPERIHPQAACWALFDQMCEAAGLYCDKFAAAVLDHLAIKAPTTYTNYKTTLLIAQRLTVH